MKQIINVVQIIFSLAGGAIGWFIGGYDGFWYTLVILTVTDYITGVMCAVLEKRLSSEVGFHGICKKLLIYMLVGVGNVLDQQIIGSV